MKFVFDLDGTLCFDGQTIADEMKELLLTAKDHGHQLIFATARSYRDCLGLLGEELSQELVIGLNGGLAYDKGKVILEHPIADTAFSDILRWSQTYNLPYFVDDYLNYSTYLPHKIPFIKRVDPLNKGKEVAVADLKKPIKVVLYMGDHEDLVADLFDDLKALGNLDLLYHEDEKCLYINPYNINKANTVMDFCGQDFVVFGNDKNDKELFKKALYAVQIGNYKPLTKYADEQILAEGNYVPLIMAKIQALFEEFGK